MTTSQPPLTNAHDASDPAPPAGRRRTVIGDAGLELAVYERGEASLPTVLLVHGYPDDHGVWDPVIDLLAADHHVVAYDVRGAGASGAPADRSGYEVEALVADLLAVADEVSPDQPVHLVAHDWGSVQSWSAVLEPTAWHRFASFTSMSGPGLDHIEAWIRRRLRPGGGRWGQLLRQGAHSGYIVFFQTPLAGWAIERVPERALAAMIRRSEGISGHDGWPGPHLRADARHGLELYRANLRGRSAERRRRTEPTPVPVQLIVATEDRYVTPAVLAETELLAPNLVRREIGGQHWLPRARPELVARLVAEHVATTVAGTEPRVDASGEIVLVTGAGSGIGRSVCLAFAARGAHVISTDIRLDAAEETAAQCREVGATAESHRLDVTDGDALTDLASTVRVSHGAPSVVVNNAGLGMAGRFLDTTDDDWAQILDVNVWGVIRGSRAFAQLMVDQGRPGHIVNIASAAAFTPSRTLPAYATSKAAVLMLTECLRAELADLGIGVSAICPGFVDTGIARSTRYVGATAAEQEARRMAADQMYKRRNVSPDVVAHAVLRAVDHDLAVVPVAAEARAGLFSLRFLPGLRRRLARLDLTPLT